MDQQVAVNHQTAADVPEEVKGLSWGGFFLNWIWGIGNSVWIALLSLVPFVGWVMPFVLLFKGNEWAWKAKEWESVEHFKRVQRLWTIWGLILFILITIGGIIFFIFFMALAASLDPSQFPDQY